MKSFYECTFICNPGLDDAQIEHVVKSVEDLISKNAGEIASVEHLGRRRLAYPIEKKHNGYYVAVEFESEGRAIEKVERFLTLDENIMRFLTLKLNAKELDAKRNRTAQELIAAGRPQQPHQPAQQEAPKSQEAAEKPIEKTPVRES